MVLKCVPRLGVWTNWVPLHKHRPAVGFVGTAPKIPPSQTCDKIVGYSRPIYKRNIKNPFTKIWFLTLVGVRKRVTIPLKFPLGVKAKRVSGGVNT